MGIISNLFFAHFRADTNRDVLADDLVAVFHKHRCSFGFASHLFSSELKILGAGGMEPSPRGISFRISPTSHAELYALIHNMINIKY